MKALVFHGPAQSGGENVEDVAVQDAADAIVRVDPTTISGTDLRILKGDVLEVSPGTILGHEVVEVRTVRPCDRVLIPCSAARGHCRFFREGAYGQSRGGGQWMLDGPIAGGEAETLVADITRGLGVDVVVEAVGEPESFEACTRMVRPGGHMADVGVHGKPATPQLEDLWVKNVTITTGLVDTYSASTRLRMMAARRPPASSPVTHTFPLDSREEAYDVFSRGADTGALEVVLGGQQRDVLTVRTV